MFGAFFCKQCKAEQKAVSVTKGKLNRFNVTLSLYCVKYKNYEENSLFRYGHCYVRHLFRL